MIHTGTDCVGVVLAGGLSSRMGQDKAQLPRAITETDQGGLIKQNMLAYSHQLLIDAGIKQTVISGDKHQIPDIVENAGPVGGIFSVVNHFPEHLQPKAFLIIPVDLPLMTGQQLAKLKLTGELSQKATFFTDFQQRIHHIPLYLPNNVFLQRFLTQTFTQQTIKNMDKAKQKSAPSVRALLANIPHLSVANNNKQVLLNTNTPEQWQQAQQQFHCNFKTHD